MMSSVSPFSLQPPVAASRGGPGGARQSKSSATAELNLLAELMGAAVKTAAGDEDEKEHKPFKINLFSEDPFEDM